MRRTTQWAVFTSMNEQPAWRSMIEPHEPAAAEPEVAEVPANDLPPARPAPARRDRVDLF